MFNINSGCNPGAIKKQKFLPYTETNRMNKSHLPGFCFSRSKKAIPAKSTGNGVQSGDGVQCGKMGDLRNATALAQSSCDAMGRAY